MYLSLIKKYISKIDTNDIKTFACNNDINLSDNEVRCLYKIMHNDTNIEQLLSNKEDLVFTKYEDSFSNENISKIKDLFYKYKNKF